MVRSAAGMDITVGRRRLGAGGTVQGGGIDHVAGQAQGGQGSDGNQTGFHGRGAYGESCSTYPMARE